MTNLVCLLGRGAVAVGRGGEARISAAAAVAAADGDDAPQRCPRQHEGSAIVAVPSIRPGSSLPKTTCKGSLLWEHVEAYSGRHHLEPTVSGISNIRKPSKTHVCLSLVNRDHPGTPTWTCHTAVSQSIHAAPNMAELRDNVIMSPEKQAPRVLKVMRTR